VHIDLSKAIETVEELRDALEELHDTEVDEAPTRAAHRQHVRLTRTLLYLAHLGDRANVEVMDVYHDFKRKDQPVGE
jgi:hypothetical protein